MATKKNRPMQRVTKKLEERSIKLDLGCGNRKEAGWVGIDKVKTPAVDIVHDLFVLPWPLKTGIVEEARSFHFFEHVPGKLRYEFMNELWRVMAPEAKCYIIIPYQSSIRSAQDPFHEWPPINEMSFAYFNQKWLKDNNLQHYPCRCNFEFVIGVGVIQNQFGWPQRNEETRNFAQIHYTNVVQDLHVTLTRKELLDA